jgi:PTH1 family peptidyl-tRNA hydrolase
LKVVVGLGNPGREYAATRHNVGWMVIDRLADRAGWAGRSRARDAAATVYGRYRDFDLMLVKPTTYMNLSGVAVRKVLARQRAPLSDMLVVVDDFALPLGRLRLRGEGSAGGHNGLRSIIAELGSQDFARLRVGIGEPSRTAIDHVLSRFDKPEKPLLEQVLEAAADVVEDWARDGTDRAANKWNAWRPITPDDAVPAEDGPSAGRSSGARSASEPPATDAASGIVRHSTGWRRLLPRRGDRAGATEND